MTNQTTIEATSPKWFTSVCPQCNKALTLEEIPHNACTPCQNSIGRVLQAKQGAPLTFINIKTTPINGESHD